MPQLSRFLAIVNDDEQPCPHTVVSVHGNLNVVAERPSGSSSSGSFFDLFQALRKRMEDTLFGRLPWNHLGGTLQLALYLLRNKKGRMCIEPHLTRAYAVSLVHTLLRLVELDDERMTKEATSPSSSTSPSPTAWSSWLSPLFVLLLELLHAPPASSDVLFARVNRQKSMAAMTHFDGANGPIISPTTPSEHKHNHPMTSSSSSSSSAGRGEEKCESFLAEEKQEGEEGPLSTVLGGVEPSSSSSSVLQKLDRASGKAGGAGLGSVDEMSAQDMETLTRDIIESASIDPEETSLLPESVWEKIFEMVVHVLQRSSSSIPSSSSSSSHTPTGVSAPSPCPTDVKPAAGGINLSISAPPCRLDPPSCQGLLIVLRLLLIKQSLASKFVAVGGLSSFLHLPVTCHSQDSAHMLTLIVQRCLESPYELRQQIVESLRTLFKTAGTPSDTRAGEQKVSFPIFLNFAAPYLVRCPQDFMAVVVAAVKFVRIIVKPASPDPSATPEKTTTNVATTSTTTAALDTDAAVPVAASIIPAVSTPSQLHDMSMPGEIHVALHKKDTMERRLLSMERGLASHHIEANGRCAVVLDTLIRHFLEFNDVIAPGPLPSPQSGTSSASAGAAGGASGAGDSKGGLGEMDSTPTTPSPANGVNKPRTRLMFTRADVIETMADCAIELFGFPAALGT